METENLSSWTSSMALTVPGLALLAICSFYLLVRRGWRGGKPRRYAPVVGTVFHQLYHVRRLHDYHTDLFRERKTFQLLAPASRRQIYTCDPAVVEHILRTNFANYGKDDDDADTAADDGNTPIRTSLWMRSLGPHDKLPIHVIGSGVWSDVGRANLDDLFGDGIFAVDGDKWRQQRKIASYDFSTRALRDFSGAVFKRNAAKLASIVSSNAASKKSMDFQASAESHSRPSSSVVLAVSSN
ncbi:hypothetical protein EJB05_23653, partial [Eragrostis curvula]